MPDDAVMAVDIKKVTELAARRGVRADDYLGYRVGVVFRLRHPELGDAEGWEWYRKGQGFYRPDGTLEYPEALTKKEVEEIRRLEATWAASPPSRPAPHCCGRHSRRSRKGSAS